ncbi:uncharacterized protein BKCO1_7900029 [Diplodia corticola]|uniref:Uncharacterized protein n=1 Tax=Diplodia corticola TaxID=236234 RepID=A0A1J9QKV7_9PEZI|nr:uncharacterized protein BKCO1_7900029 [Diplodia corticola]OJD29518.1 hypothetical protein BKCO1_7900029 [Diplodia corticola]
MDNKALNQGPRRTPANAARQNLLSPIVQSAHGERIHGAPPPPPASATRPLSFKPATRPPVSKLALRPPSAPMSRPSSSLAFSTSIRTRAAARRESAAIESALAESAALPRSPGVSAAEPTQENKKTKKKTRRARRRTAATSAADRNDDVDEAHTTTNLSSTTDANAASEPPDNAGISPPPPHRTRPTLSARHILAQLLARLPAHPSAIHAHLAAPLSSSVWDPSTTADPPRYLRIRPLFDDARAGHFGNVGRDLEARERDGDQDRSQSPTRLEKKEGKGKKKEKKEIGADTKNELDDEKTKEQQRRRRRAQKKRRDDVLRKTLARVVADTRDGCDALANAGYFLQVLEEVAEQRARVGVTVMAGGVGGAGDDDEDGGTSDGLDDLPWFVEEVFKIVVILVSWQRELEPRGGGEEKEDEGCVMSTRQVVRLVEGEIEQAVKEVEGPAC